MILNRKDNQGWRIGKTGLISLLFLTIASSPLHLLLKSSLATDVTGIKDIDAIEKDNSKDFQFSLQDTFNHNSSASIYHGNDEVESLTFIRQKRSDRTIPRPNEISLSVKPTKCHLRGGRCK